MSLVVSHFLEVFCDAMHGRYGQALYGQRWRIQEDMHQAAVSGIIGCSAAGCAAPSDTGGSVQLLCMS